MDNGDISHFVQHEARAFLLALTARADGINGKFIMASFNEGLPPEIQQIDNDKRAIERMVAVAREWTSVGKNVYSALSLMRADLPDGKKGTEGDVVAVLGFGSDFDAKHGPSTFAARLPVEASSVVETSAGNYQAFIFLEEPVPPAEAKVVARNLTNLVRCDPTSSDISHVFRVPGTLNVPSNKKIAEGRSRQPQSVHLRSSIDTWEERPTLAQLGAAIRNRSHSDSDPKAAVSPSVSLGLPEKRDLSVADIKALLCIEVGDRSARFAGFVWECKRRGYTPEETIALALEYTTSPVVLHFDGDTGRIESDVERLWKKSDADLRALQPSGPDKREIQRLAALSPLDYDRERDSAAERLSCRVGTLDKLVQDARNTDGSPTLQGRQLELRDPDPWPDAVRGDELLDEIVATIKRHVVMDDATADSIALWTLAVHTFDSFSVFPRLGIVSPEKQCGKTTLLDILGRVLPRALVASNITAAALFRMIEKARPTILLDEADTFLPNNEELRGILNSGHRRDEAYVIRTVGEDYEPRTFSTWSPAVLAAIGRLPDTLEDRSVIVPLRRRRKDEPIERLRLDRMGMMNSIARKASRWTKDYGAQIAVADPVMPGELFNRTADNWRPLLAVADVAGGEWPERARRAAIATVRAHANGDEQSQGVLLLRDLKAMFDIESATVLFTDEILGKLIAMEDRPWAELARGRPVSPNRVAALLKPFGISPSSVRRGSETRKGYRRASLNDAFERYLSDQTVTPSQAAE